MTDSTKYSAPAPANPIKDYPLSVRKQAPQIVKARWDKQYPPPQSQRDERKKATR